MSKLEPPWGACDRRGVVQAMPERLVPHPAPSVPLTPPERGGPSDAQRHTDAGRAQDSILVAAEGEMAGDTPSALEAIGTAIMRLDLWRTRLLSAQTSASPCTHPGCAQTGLHECFGPYQRPPTT